ncbi:hypothetical protein GMRT_14277 [Giardia muris]|uniref:Uncharacterized protein n=1 Tax=Giardia muris TaxID=5742 RepID=A0A4Z1SWI9_GIAMU|nr:hypothetical protein GMRT_14277 [Giardia muris]|eukprot:TNJ30182.1 hypothetical protein GMRT_14277 [Giardia muris]
MTRLAQPSFYEAFTPCLQSLRDLLEAHELQPATYHGFQSTLLLSYAFDILTRWDGKPLDGAILLWDTIDLAGMILSLVKDALEFLKPTEFITIEMDPCPTIFTGLKELYGTERVVSCLDALHEHIERTQTSSTRLQQLDYQPESPLPLSYFFFALHCMCEAAVDAIERIGRLKSHSRDPLKNGHPILFASPLLFVEARFSTSKSSELAKLTRQVQGVRSSIPPAIVLIEKIKDIFEHTVLTQAAETALTCPNPILYPAPLLRLRTVCKRINVITRTIRSQSYVRELQRLCAVSFSGGTRTTFLREGRNEWVNMIIRGRSKFANKVEKSLEMFIVPVSRSIITDW